MSSRRQLDSAAAGVPGGRTARELPSRTPRRSDRRCARFARAVDLARSVSAGGDLAGRDDHFSACCCLGSIREVRNRRPSRLQKSPALCRPFHPRSAAAADRCAAWLPGGAGALEFPRAVLAHDRLASDWSPARSLRPCRSCGFCRARIRDRAHRRERELCDSATRRSCRSRRCSRIGASRSR